MDKGINRAELCFNLEKYYEDNVRYELEKNNISNKYINHIMEQFNFEDKLVISLNKEYEKGEGLLEFCRNNNLSQDIPDMLNFYDSLYKHQENAIKSILNEKCTVISTGTGSGKTESFLIPILDYCIQNKGKKGVKAIIIYPMNALAADQLRRIEGACKDSNITYAVFNGETPSKGDSEHKSAIHMKNHSENTVYREDIVENKPDILITNYVMLDRILTNDKYNIIFDGERGVFKYIVLDEIHTYNGNKALHIKYLLHRLRYGVKGNVVQIGCSATLSSTKSGQKTGGYMDAANGGIDEFIKNMFNIKNENDYKYIEPEFKGINDIDYDVEDEEYIKLKESRITKLIKSCLYEGSKTLKDLLATLNDEEQKLKSEDLKKYFISVLKINERFPDKPLLDFRIHLFLLEIGDTLRRCIKCGKYYTLPINKCNECGHIILPVHRYNPDLYIGELKKGVIIDPTMATSKKESENKNIVLLDFNYRIEDESDSKCKTVDLNEQEFLAYVESNNNNLKQQEILNFDNYETNENSIKLIIDKEGKNKIYYVEDNLISNIKLGKPYSDSFIAELLKYNFNGLNNKDRKILSFVDNRERCGRCSTVFGDTFLSELFYEILKFINNKKLTSVSEIQKNIKEELEEFFKGYSSLDDIMKETILHDFEHWFRRLLMKDRFSDEFREKLFLDEDSHEPLTSDEKIMLLVFLIEGAFFRKRLEDYGKYIRLDRSYYEFGKAIGFKEHKCISVISLSDQGKKYKAIVERLGQPEIKKIIKSLISKGIIEGYGEKDEISILNDQDDYLESIFLLNPNKIFLKSEDSKYNTLEEIFEEHLIFTGVHTSEVENEKRKENEDKFQKGEINLLISTSTLEMGIDIGSLSFVYMIGVPALPSNYSQRAGRSGRRGNRFAGIITICSERSNHDWHYFYNPKEMIEGLITPPKFRIDNNKVLNKHVNTIIYPKLKSNILSEIDRETMVNLENYCEDVFNKAIYIDDQIDILRNKVKNIKSTTTNALYNKGVYPEYNFTREEVKLIEYMENNKDNKSTENTDIEKNEEKVLTTREPELAYKQISLWTSMFIGNKYYYIYANDINKTFEGMNGEIVIDCWKLICKDNENYISQKRDASKKKRKDKGDKENKEIDTYVNINFNRETKINYKKGPIKIYLKKYLKMEFISKETIGNPDEGEFIYTGYQITRDAIIFEFDSNVINDHQYISFISLLDKVIKSEFGLDNGEIGIIFDDEEIFIKDVSREERKKEKKAYVIMYDKSGNNNIDMYEIIESLEPVPNNELLNKAFDLVTKCQCTKESGCYLCLKSYNTQRLGDKLSKVLAKNMVGYLIGKEKLRPRISTKVECLEYEVEINLQQKGEDFNFTIINKYENKPKHKIMEARKSQNETIMTGLYNELKNIYINDDIETILIKSKMPYVVNAINESGKFNSDVEILNKFSFYKQAYKNVKAQLQK